MNSEVFLFFDRVPEAFPLYETLRRALFLLYPDMRIKTGKTAYAFSLAK